jgi:Alkylmercury lyase
MCAIDALGISDMLGAGVLIQSADPSTGELVFVAVDEGSAVSEPDTAAVFAGHTTSAVRRTVRDDLLWAHELCTSHAMAAAWASAHPEIMGGILSQAGAGRWKPGSTYSGSFTADIAPSRRGR